MLAYFTPERARSQTSDEYTSINTSKGEKTISEEQKDSQDDSNSRIMDIKKEFKNFNQKDEDISFQKGSTKSKRNFIEKHAFISSKFQKNLASKRCEALLDYKLTSSSKIEIQKFELTWNYKFSMTSDTPPPESLTTTHSLNSLALPTFSTLASSLSTQNLLKLPSNAPSSSNLSLTLTAKSFLFGHQKWEFLSTDTSIPQQEVVITQI